MFNFLGLLKNRLKVRANMTEEKNGSFTENELTFYFKGGVFMKVTRRSCAPPQNELSAVIPRAELRSRRYENGKLVHEEEIILNSVTLVDAPRHRREKG